MPLDQSPWNFSFGSTGSNPDTSPYPDRQLPSWMPSMNSMTRELSQQYAGINHAFDTSEYDAASRGTESNILTTGLNAGNNAATAYANKARQMGGSQLGAGLVKAEGAVAGRRAAGDIAEQRARFDVQQREAAATQAGQIASTLGSLRNEYLKSLVSYTTSEDQISANARRDENSGGGGRGPALNFTTGTGLGMGSSAFNFGNSRDVQNYFNANAGSMSPYGFIPSRHG